MELDNSYPQIIVEKALPIYTSPYIESRKSHAAHVYKAIQKKDLTEADIAEVLGSRSKFPLAACFNVHTLCNSRCIMCPYKDSPLSKDHVKFMDFESYAKLLDEFCRLGGRIATFNNYSDIFAHNGGMKYVEHALDHYYSEIQLYFVTNAIGLSKKKIDAILSKNFSGIVYVSCHAFTRETYQRVTGKDRFFAVRDSITYLAKNHNYPQNIIVQYATDFSSDDEIKESEEYWHSLGVSTNYLRTHTFSGNSSHKAQDANPHPLRGCRGWGYDAGLPFYQVIIQDNLDITLCCMDLKRACVVSDVRNSTLSEAWNGKEFLQAIRQIYCGESGKFSGFCRKCNNAVYFKEKKSLWRRIVGR